MTVCEVSNRRKDYAPTVFENTVVTVKLDDSTSVDMELWDTAGQEQFDQLRPFSYDNADVALLSFSVNDRQSLLNVQDKWIASFTRKCPLVPIILVGLKTDLRDDHNAETSISTETARTVAVNLTALYNSRPKISKKRFKGSTVNPSTALLDSSYAYLHSILYLECSSRLNSGLQQVFQHAANAAMSYRTYIRLRQNSKKCNIL